MQLQRKCAAARSAWVSGPAKGTLAGHPAALPGPLHVPCTLGLAPTFVLCCVGALSPPWSMRKRHGRGSCAARTQG